jgi:hypothetical protein
MQSAKAFTEKKSERASADINLIIFSPTAASNGASPSVTVIGPRRLGSLWSNSQPHRGKHTRVVHTLTVRALSLRFVGGQVRSGRRCVQWSGRPRGRGIARSLPRVCGSRPSTRLRCDVGRAESTSPQLGAPLRRSPSSLTSRARRPTRVIALSRSFGKVRSKRVAITVEKWTRTA